MIFILAAGKLTHEIHVSKLTWGEGVGSKEGQTTNKHKLWAQCHISDLGAHGLDGVAKVPPPGHHVDLVGLLDDVLEAAAEVGPPVDGHGGQLPLGVVGVGVHLQREGEALEGGVVRVH